MRSFASFSNKDVEWGKHNIVVKRGAHGEMQAERSPLEHLPTELKAVIEEMK